MGGAVIDKDRLQLRARYYLDGSAFKLRRAGWGFAVLEPPEPVTITVVPVTPPCLDASDDTMEEEWLEAQMQEEMFDIDHA